MHAYMRSGITNLSSMPMHARFSSTASFAQHTIRHNNAPSRILMPMDDRTKVRLWNVATNKGEKRHGINKDVLLWILLVAQDKFQFSKTVDLTKLTSKSLRRVLKKNYDTIVSRPFLVARNAFPHPGIHTLDTTITSATGTHDTIAAAMTNTVATATDDTAAAQE